MNDRPLHLRHPMKYKDWMLAPRAARIVGLDEVRKEIAWLSLDHGTNYKVVCTSGGYDPIHPGHISCLLDSANTAETAGELLVVIVNGDSFLKNKKGKPFMDLKTRCQIVSAISCVDIVVPFEVENDSTVCKALEAINPDFFTKGGDRKDPSTIPEWEICQKLGIEVMFGMGQPKFWSSSDFLKKWRDNAS